MRRLYALVIGSVLLVAILGARAFAGAGTGALGFAGSASAGTTLTAVQGAACSRAAAPFCWPASVSSNGRFLVDQSGHPYMIVGDSPQSLAVNLTTAQANAYFANRHANGFNAAWVQVLCNTYTGGRSDGKTYDGIAPFLTPGDFSTPNPAYFRRLDAMIKLAAAHGITVFLDPVDTGGWMGQIEDNGPSKDYKFGVYLGQRYKNYPNIVWINGNDFTSWNNYVDGPDVLDIAKGIASADHRHLQTVELGYFVSSSLDDKAWSHIIKLNLAYMYWPTYAEVLHAYNQTPRMPAFLGEANYEFENNTGLDPPNPITLRLQEWWTMTSGATGQMYGSDYTWNDGTNWADESHHLNTVGVRQLRYMTALFHYLPWATLVPDQSHHFVTAGYGTFSAAKGPLAANNYVTAEVNPGHTTGIAYLPQHATITVNMAAIRSAVRARWFNPTTGTFRNIGTFANSGSRRFTSPGGHSDGTDDWVLLLQATS